MLSGTMSGMVEREQLVFSLDHCFYVYMFLCYCDFPEQTVPTQLSVPSES